MMDIPTVDGNERTDLLHPVFAARVAALCADPRMRGLLEVDSAARTYAEQKILYDGYTAGLPGFNLAANPDRAISPAYGLEAPRGSWHMQQADGHAYAVDFATSRLPWEVRNQLETVARDYLLIRTVPTEDWHYQMTWGDWWTVPHRATGDDTMTPEQEAKLDALVVAVMELDDQVRCLRRQVSTACEKPSRTIQQAVGAIAKKLDA